MIQTDTAKMDEAARSARLFRSALDAMARPTRAASMQDAPPPPQAADGGHGLSRAAFGLLTLLSDADAPWWLASDRADAETRRALTFATSAAMASGPGAAAFLCGGWAALADEAIPHAALGDADYPDRSATLIIEVAGFSENAGAQTATLAGPGLKQPVRFSVEGVDARFWPFIAANRQRFPLGLDLYLAAGDAVVGLPRSVSVIV